MVVRKSFHDVVSKPLLEHPVLEYLPGVCLDHLAWSVVEAIVESVR
jgi:hypothetical protein